MPSAFGFAFVVGVIHVIGVGDPKIGVESIGRGEDFRMMTQVPFSKTGCRVALRFEMVCNRMLVGV